MGPSIAVQEQGEVLHTIFNSSLVSDLAMRLPIFIALVKCDLDKGQPRADRGGETLELGEGVGELRNLFLQVVVNIALPDDGFLRSRRHAA